MKYSCKIEINKPIDHIIELFDDAENLKKWMKGLDHFEHLSGTAGQPGAQSRLVFNEKGRRIEMIETITARDLPESFAGKYEINGIENYINNSFMALDENRTLYTTENEFIFSGLMKILAIFMKRMFISQSMKHMKNFKTFAEKQN